LLTEFSSFIEPSIVAKDRTATKLRNGLGTCDQTLYT